MNDKYEELDKIIMNKIAELENCGYDRLLEICEEENIDNEQLKEEELREALIEYFNDELEY